MYNSLSSAEYHYPKASQVLKYLVWLYFWLLIFEGALRKWALPEYSAPLLIIRDPVIILIFLKAAAEGLLPRGGFFSGWVMVAIAITILMFSQMFALTNPIPKAVLVYGWRTYLLHLPLIFLLPQIFDRQDLAKMGQWILVLAMPMAVLMAYQFRAPADAWINRTVGLAGGTQIMAAMGKIRPPGTFSFISGPVGFFALATAFAGYGLLAGRLFINRWLLAAAIAGIGLAVVVSGSRATLLAAGIVVLVCIIGISSSGRVTAGLTGLITPLLLAFFVLGQLDVVQEGTEVISTRWEQATQMESETGGLMGRALEAFTSPLLGFFDYPPLGEGMGLGTNVGAMLASGRVQFLLAEGEWGRILGEMGPIFGGIFLLYRIFLTLWLATQSLLNFRHGNVLPLFLFSACGVNLFSGQFAQPTTLGFAVFGAGLCLTAMRVSLDPAPQLSR